MSTNDKKADFADQVLSILEIDHDWSADTMEQIAETARQANLAHDEGAFFKAGPGPPDKSTTIYEVQEEVVWQVWTYEFDEAVTLDEARAKISNNDGPEPVGLGTYGEASYEKSGFGLDRDEAVANMPEDDKGGAA